MKCCGRRASCMPQYLALPPSSVARPVPAPPAAGRIILGVPALLPCGVRWPGLAGEAPTGRSVLPSAPVTVCGIGRNLQVRSILDSEEGLQTSTILTGQGL